MDRVLQRNVLAMSGRAVEAAGDVDTLLLDKTGTITLGNRQATEIIARARVPARSDCASRPTLLASPTRRPKAARSWRSREPSGITRRGARRRDPLHSVQRVHAHERHRSSPTGRKLRKGAPDAVTRLGSRAGRRSATIGARRRRSSASHARAARRCWLRATRRSSASSTSRISSSRTCAIGSTACVRWAFARS